MSKQRKNIIMAILILIALIGAIFGFFIIKKNQPKDIPKDDTSSVISETIKVEDIEEEQEGGNSTSSSEPTISYIEPDETKADEILEEKKKEQNSNVSNNTSVTSSDSTTKDSEQSQGSNTQSFEEGQKALENTAEKYLKEHNIDPKTAGETGEQCPHCGKKIWNPDKYGNFIPGMPDDYENSGYCLGTCAISFG